MACAWHISQKIQLISKHYSKYLNWVLVSIIGVFDILQLKIKVKKSTKTRIGVSHRYQSRIWVLES